MSGVAFLAEGLDPARGGAQRAIRAVAPALAREGVPVALVAPADRAGGPEPGVRLVPVELRSRTRAGRATEVAQGLAASARAAVPGAVLVACGKLLGADVLWSHGGVHAASVDAAARAGRSWLGGVFARAARRLRPVEGVFRSVERANAAAARGGRLRVVALSDRVRRDLARWHGLDPARVSVVRNGVALEAFRLDPEGRARARAELVRRAGGDGEPLAVAVAHAFALKGVDRAIAGLVHAPRARLLVIGRGTPGRFAGLARRHGVAGRVAFAGEVAGLERLLGGACVLVHASRYDPCSLVVLEALAAGVPVIGSADGACELLGGGGFVLERGDDARELGERLEAFADRGVRERASAGASAAARSIEECARELRAVLRLEPDR